MNNLKTVLLAFFVTLISFGQNSERKFESVIEGKHNVQIVVSDGKYIIQYFNPEIIETSFLPKGEEYTYKSHAVVAYTNEREFVFAEEDSYVNQNNPIETVKEDSNQIEILTQGIQVHVQKQPFQISYSYKGEDIISEKRGYYKAAHQPMDMVNGNIVEEETERIEFNLTQDEVLYGGGARALGMNRRGYKLPLYNKAHYGYETHSELMNFTLPIVMSSKQYMIHFDNAPVGYLDFDSKKDNTLTYETISGRKTYQIIVGDSWEKVVENYTDLTGKQPLPPRWAFGNFSSRFGYHSQEETEATIDAFKDEEIPVDAIILDLYWFGKEVQGTMGNLSVDRDSFPDFEGMVSRLNNKGVKTVVITEPFILTTSSKWEEAVKEDVIAKDSLGNPYTYDFYFGNTGLVDIYKPEAEKWFWNIYKEIADLGVAGVWGDLGEPEVHPAGVIHAAGTANEVHNIYGHDWARLVYEGYERDFPNQRPFILMRAGYSGSQRYGLIPWSGDVNRTWGGMHNQAEIALQMGMQGLAYMHSDLGGFAGANLDDELYTRWLQYGVFQPIYRPHAQEDVASEPVFREEKTKQLAKQSIELRYSLLPYNYNLAFENSTKGTPLMRPLFFVDDNPELYSNSSTYLWGEDFLITPVLEAGAKEVEVYFPKGSNWIDFYTGEIVEGGQSKMVQTKENSIPTFVRAGAFIPMVKQVQSTNDYSLNDFELHFYYNNSISNSKAQVYNDDGLLKDAYSKGEYEILEFASEKEKRWLEFKLKAEIGDKYTSTNKKIKLVIHNLDKFPKRIKINGKKRMFYLENEGKDIVIPITWNTTKKAELKIKLKK